MENKSVETENAILYQLLGASPLDPAWELCPIPPALCFLVFHILATALQLLSTHPSFTHTSALSIQRFYPPFTRCHIRLLPIAHIGCPGKVTGTFIPTYFRTGTFVPWNSHSQELSFPGTFALR